MALGEGRLSLLLLLACARLSASLGPAAREGDGGAAAEAAAQEAQSDEEDPRGSRPGSWRLRLAERRLSPSRRSLLAGEPALKDFKEDPSPLSVECPFGYAQLGERGDDVPGAGMSKWSNKALIIEDCAEQCEENPDCGAFEFCPSNGNSCFLLAWTQATRDAQTVKFKKDAITCARGGAKPAAKSVNARGQSLSGCMISSASHEGVGHQLEAKLSCIGVASALGMEYVHQPITATGGPADALLISQMEQFFNLGEGHRRFDGSKMRVKGRDTPYIGKCKKDGWLRRVEQGYQTCSQDGVSVFSHDNCFDRFYCHNMVNTWYAAVPAVQRAYYSTEKPDPNWFEGFKHDQWGAKVVVHIKKPDNAGRRADAKAYPEKIRGFEKKLDKLRRELRKKGPRPPLFRIQTDSTREELLKVSPFLNATDIQIDDSNSTLTMALHRMISADVFVMSSSSLSMTAALVGNQTRIVSPCLEAPIGKNVSLLHWEQDCSLGKLRMR